MSQTHPTRTVVQSTQIHRIVTPASKAIRKLGTSVYYEDLAKMKQEKLQEEQERQARKEERSKITDEQVRVLRRAYEIDNLKPAKIFEMYGEEYGITKPYLTSILTYQTRSKVLI